MFCFDDEKCKLNFYLLITGFCNFFLQNLIFFKNKQNSEQLNVLWSIFLLQVFFLNFNVDFWPLLNVEKELIQADFGGVKKLL